MFKSELTDYLCLLTKSMRLKQKCLFQSVLMIAYFDPCFWSEILKNKLEAQNTIAEQLHYKQFYQNLYFCEKVLDSCFWTQFEKVYISTALVI